jgi:protein arginine N-methyltransferase 5
MDQKVTLFYSLDDLELLSSAQRDGGHRLDIAELVEDTLQQQYGAVGLPLTNNNWRDRWKRLCLSSDGSTSKDTSLQTEAELWRAGQKSFQLDEVVLARLEESPNVIAFASDWISLDARDEWVRHDAEIALYQEVAWAGYLNVQTLVLPPPRDRAHVASYARAVNASVDHIGSAQLYLSIRIPIYDPHLLMDGAPCTELTPEARMSMCWEMWDTIRTMCAYTNRISLSKNPHVCIEHLVLILFLSALDLNMSFAVQNVPYSFDRWISEPTRHIILPASSFVPNPKGYPVLTKPLQQFIRNVVKVRPDLYESTQAEDKRVAPSNLDPLPNRSENAHLWWLTRIPAIHPTSHQDKPFYHKPKHTRNTCKLHSRMGRLLSITSPSSYF